MTPVYIMNFGPTGTTTVAIKWSIEGEPNYTCPKCKRAAIRLGDGLPDDYCIDCDKNPEYYDEDGDLVI